MADVKKRDLIMVPFEKLLIIDDFNIRVDMGDIPALADNIKENGIKVPLRGYKEKGEDIYRVVDGHRRHAAIKLLVSDSTEIFYVPFVLEPQKYSDEQRVIDMFIMNDGKNLTPLEQAEGVRRMQNWGYPDKDISQKIGRSIAYVGKLSSLNTAPKRMIKLIENGKIAASLAMDIISKGETDKFLQDVDAGFFDAQRATNGHDIPEPEVITKTKIKITKGDLKEVNSWKEFKKWAKNIDVHGMEEEKIKIFKWLCRMMNNELNEDHFKRFFK
jgi:ParB/RepB/Spo0J family partition protein